MIESEERYICKTDGFSTSGFWWRNKNMNTTIRINHGDIVQADLDGYLWKDGICLCHKESIVGKYHFQKFSKK